MRICYADRQNCFVSITKTIIAMSLFRYEDMVDFVTTLYSRVRTNYAISNVNGAWAEQNKYLKDWLGTHSTGLNILFFHILWNIIIYAFETWTKTRQNCGIYHVYMIFNVTMGTDVRSNLLKRPRTLFDRQNWHFY